MIHSLLLSNLSHHVPPSPPFHPSTTLAINPSQTAVQRLHRRAREISIQIQTNHIILLNGMTPDLNRELRRRDLLRQIDRLLNLILAFLNRAAEIGFFQYCSEISSILNFLPRARQGENQQFDVLPSSPQTSIVFCKILTKPSLTTTSRYVPSSIFLLAVNEMVALS